MDIVDDMGVSKLSAKVFVFFKVNYSFNCWVILPGEYLSDFIKADVNTYSTSSRFQMNNMHFYDTQSFYLLNTNLQICWFSWVEMGCNWSGPSQ